MKAKAVKGLGMPESALSRRCQLWAVLNVTPDSFSDGGEAVTLETAVAKAKRLLSEGADIIDVGGASSRPPGKTYGEGAPQVSLDEELERVVPVVRALARELGAKVSVDTTRPEVARAALEAGAVIINDVSNGASDALLEAVASASAELVLMHNRGDGRIAGENIQYASVIDDVLAELSAAAVRASCAGIPFRRIWVDPGIGFAKTAAQSLEVLAALPRFVKLGYPVLVGPSRKSFIAAAERAAGVSESGPAERIGGTAAAVTASVLAGARGVRVHDVREMLQAVLLTEALCKIGGSRLALGNVGGGRGGFAW
jgi:dihydropteroate synthase